MKTWLIERGTRVVGAVCRRAFVLFGRDITDRTVERSCLVIAPHPDDEVLGCGVTIMRKLAAGAAVRVVYVTDGRHSHRSEVIGPNELAALRREEAYAATACLGLPREDLVFLDFEDGAVVEQSEAIANRLREIVAEIDPDEIFAASGYDGHVDHRALDRVVRALVAEGATSADVYQYPVWFWARKSWVRAGTSRLGRFFELAWRPLVILPRLRPRLVRTAGYLDRKRAALDAYRSQMTCLTGEASWATFEDAFLRNFFLRYELFFELRIDRAVAPALDPAEAR